MRWRGCPRRERGECQWRGPGPAGRRTDQRIHHRTLELPVPHLTEPEELEVVMEGPDRGQDLAPSLLEADIVEVPVVLVVVLVLVEDQV